MQIHSPRLDRTGPTVRGHPNPVRLVAPRTTYHPGKPTRIKPHKTTSQSSRPMHPRLNPLPSPGWTDFSRSGKSAAEFAQEPSQFARMAPGPSRRRGRPAPPTPRIWLTAGALLAVACQGGGERPLETSAGLSLAPWGLAEPAAAAARASEPVIAQPAVGQIRTSGAVPRAPGG